MTPEQREFAKKLIFGNGFKIIGTGVVTAKNAGDPEEVCKFAKEFNIKVVTTEATKEQLPLWEKTCQK